MAGKNFLLLSMEDTKIKKVSNVISNHSCRKILDYLSNRENATETELAEKLQSPISTVHYNISQLMEVGLISSEEFHYSKKGKEVNHYRLANKYIIIAPKSTYGIREKLKNILPTALIVSAAAAVIQFLAKYSTKGSSSSVNGADLTKSAMESRVMSAAPSLSDAAMQSNPGILQNIALWFLAGAIFALVVYFIVGALKKYEGR